MNGRESSKIPYVQQKRRVGQVSKRIVSHSGVKTPIASWVSSGNITPLERGLQMASTSSISKPFVDPALVQKQLDLSKQAILNKYYETFGLEPINIEESDEKQKAAEDPQIQRLTSSILARSNPAKRNITVGIIPKPLSDDIIDSIGTLTLGDKSSDTKSDKASDPFSAIPNNFSIPRAPTMLSSSALIRDQLRSISRCGPLQKDECECDFPIADIYGSSSITPQSEEEDEPHESLLVDPDEKKIIWAKGNIPFTRDEVRMLSEWRERNRRIGDIPMVLNQKVIEEHEKDVKQAFQSREALSMHIKLSKKQIKSVAGPEKAGKSGGLSWKKVSKTANSDQTSVPFRKALWAKFAIGVHSVGGVKSDSQEQFALSVRRRLMDGCVANFDLFWEILDSVETEFYFSAENMVVVEVLREAFEVSSSEVERFLTERKMPVELYKLAPLLAEKYRGDRDAKRH